MIASKVRLDRLEIEGTSVHSIRVGSTKNLLNSGAKMPFIMHRGRWSKTDKVTKYLQHDNYMDYCCPTKNF